MSSESPSPASGETQLPCAVLGRLAQTLEARKRNDPKESYVASLLAEGLDAVLKKVGEECTEVLLAAKSGDPQHVVRETADLWFHSLVMLAKLDLHPDDVLNELRRREGRSGLVEKAARTT